MESLENLPNYSKLAEELNNLQIEESGHGKGVDYINWIVRDLKNGDIERAKANYRNQADKYTHYPKTKAFLKEIGIVEEIDWSKLRDE